MSDAFGELTEEHHYDAFGAERVLLDRDLQFAHAGMLVFNTKGFTGHERLFGSGLIHMNGRMFDAQIGRFLSADPHIQSPLMSQSLNRYSYVLNNPLSLTDPSGYFFKSLFKSLKKLWKKIKKVIQKVVKKNRKKIELFYLPAYSPELNSEEYLNCDLKAGSIQSHQQEAKKSSSTKCGHIGDVTKIACACEEVL